MRSIYLCGHTGSENRGCDAIVRSTVGILNAVGESQISLMTFGIQQDLQLGLDKFVELIPYPKKTLLMKVAGRLMKTVFGNGVWGQKCLHRELRERLKPGDVVFNIGGDTYCYSKPYISFALNEVTEADGIPCVFWACSIDQTLEQDMQMQRDVNRYAYIVARETMSHEMLHSCIKEKEKLYLACDPAFALEPAVTELPEGFVPGNTVGINLSPLVFADSENITDMMYKNVFCMIDRILSETELSICLIPHVYHVLHNTGDICILRRIYERYKQNERVSIVEKELNSQQLKYIISNCRFFVGARTHSMIAAYSSEVPGLALSYSVKSRGLAKDIFGKEDTYAIPWQAISYEEQLSNAFFEVLVKKEDWMRQCYQLVIPAYRAKITEAAKSILDKL